MTDHKTNVLNEDTNDLSNQKKYADRVRLLIAEKEKRLGRRLSVFVQTFGCQQNEADSERLIGTALSLGYEKAASPESADLIIYNTCAVREHAELKALSKTGQLKHIKAANPELLVGLWGCMVNQEHRVSDIKNKYPYVDFVADTNMLHRLPEILCDVMVNHRRRYYVEDGDAPIVEGVPVSRESDIKAWLSIMYGCDNFCTYCVVPHVRGRERSRKPEEVLAEAGSLVENGCREITLLGQNVNSYGKGLEEPCSFAELLSKVASLDGDFWVRFMTSHPKDVSDELIEVMRTHDRVAKHFHLPVQSGNDRVLAKMNRKYTREKYLEVVKKLRAAMPDITLTTDIIVGFPGETEEMFKQTEQYVRDSRFLFAHIFPYSDRAGTEASERTDKIAEPVKKERAARLKAVMLDVRKSVLSGFLGSVRSVLVEKIEDGTAVGYTDNYIETHVKVGVQADIAENSFLTVRLTDIAEDLSYMTAEPVKEGVF